MDETYPNIHNLLRNTGYLERYVLLGLVYIPIHGATRRDISERRHKLPLFISTFEILRMTPLLVHSPRFANLWLRLSSPWTILSWRG